MTPKNLKADSKRCRWHRRKLISARRDAYMDAESFPTVIAAIEEVGKLLNPDGSGLGNYRDNILEFLFYESDSQETVEVENSVKDDVERLLFLLTQSRNDHAHRGAYARNITKEAVHVALLLEEALAISWKDIQLKDVMVAPITVAEWNTLDEARTLMLGNAFSYLPILWKGAWHLLADTAIAEFLRCYSNGDRKTYGKKMLSELIELRPELLKGSMLHPKNNKVSETPFDTGLVLITDDLKNQLCGVVSPADII